MASCDKCGREIKNYGVFDGGIRCANYCDAHKANADRREQYRKEMQHALERVAAELAAGKWNL